MKPALKPGYLGHWTQDLIWRNAKQMQEEDSDGEA